MQVTNVSGLWLGVLLLAAAGCGGPTDSGPGSSSDAGTYNSDEGSSQERSTLARTHDLVVDVDADALDTGYQAIQRECDEVEHCTVLNASITSSYRKSAALRLRLAPESVSAIDAKAASFGEVTHRSTTVVDLAKPIFDQEERLGMLRQYMENLEELRTNAQGDIEALVQVASEMASTQSKIESAVGERAQLLQRVETEILSVDLVADLPHGFWGTIGMAILDFGEELSYGIAEMISGSAHVLPWFVVLVPFLYLVRWIWGSRK